MTQEPLDLYPRTCQCPCGCDRASNWEVCWPCWSDTRDVGIQGHLAKVRQRKEATMGEAPQDEQQQWLELLSNALGKLGTATGRELARAIGEPDEEKVHEGLLALALAGRCGRIGWVRFVAPDAPTPPLHGSTAARVAGRVLAKERYR